MTGGGLCSLVHLSSIMVTLKPGGPTSHQSWLEWKSTSLNLLTASALD